MSTSSIDELKVEPLPRDIRKVANMSTRMVGKALGLSHVRISQIERKGTDSTKHIQAMADLYGVSFEVMRAAISRVSVC